MNILMNWSDGTAERYKLERSSAQGIQIALAHLSKLGVVHMDTLYILQAVVVRRVSVVWLMGQPDLQCTQDFHWLVRRDVER